MTKNEVALVNNLLSLSEARKVVRQLESEVERLTGIIGEKEGKGFRIVNKPSNALSWRKYLDFLKPFLSDKLVAAEDDFCNKEPRLKAELI